MVEYAHPPLISHLPPAWSFMPFMCLPDGAHSCEEEFICKTLALIKKDFHLPPVPEWTTYPQKTIFGLACYRQIDATVKIQDQSHPLAIT